MESRRVEMNLLALLVIGPFSLLAIYLTGLWLSLSPWGESEYGPTLQLTLIVLAGWAGLASLWSFYFHYRRSLQRPAHLFLRLCGLGAGTAASLVIIGTVGISSTPLFAIIFGWPLIAVLVFVVMTYDATRAA